MAVTPPANTSTPTPARHLVVPLLLALPKLKGQQQMTKPIQLWACGGGRQSAGIAAMIALGALPRPDAACMVQIEWEIHDVEEYVRRYIVPSLSDVGIPFHFIPRAQYATKGLLGGADGKTCLMPMFTNQSGRVAKFEEYCSGEWKREVTLRWAREQTGWKDRGVRVWLGISADEGKRRRGARRQWIQPVYPLLDVRPSNVRDCLAAVKAMGWPEPRRSRCYHCPNQPDGEWGQLTPAEWEAAAQTEELLQKADPNVFLHKSCVPLRQVELHPERDRPHHAGGCTAGTCF